MEFDLSFDLADAARRAIRDWMPHQAAELLDAVDKLESLGIEESWADEDGFATQCELLAYAARTAATLGQRLDLAERARRSA